jgi:hypothetical protein
MVPVGAVILRESYAEPEYFDLIVYPGCYHNLYVSQFNQTVPLHEGESVKFERFLYEYM